LRESERARTVHPLFWGFVWNCNCIESKRESEDNTPFILGVRLELHCIEKSERARIVHPSFWGFVGTATVERERERARKVHPLFWGFVWN